jgi:HEAT repeat protein
VACYTKLLVTKFKRISLLLLLAAGALALFFLGSWALEPRYQGRTVRAWFKEACKEGGSASRDQSAMRALAAMGDSAAPYLAKTYTRQDSSWKQSLAKWVRQRGWISFPSERERSTKAYVILMEIGPNGKGAVPALVKAARSKTHRRRAGAIQLLGAIHREPRLAVPALIDCLKEKNGYVRTFAAAALGAFGPEGRPALPALREALEDQDIYLAVAAASALLKIDESADAGWPLLIEELQSSIPTHRVEAARALGNLGPRAEEAMPLLRKGLDDEDHRVRRAAALALQQIASQRGGNTYDR